jgi:hypothetical protein
VPVAQVQENGVQYAELGSHVSSEDRGTPVMSHMFWPPLFSSYGPSKHHLEDEDLRSRRDERYQTREREGKKINSLAFQNVGIFPLQRCKKMSSQGNLTPSYI